MGKYIQGPWHGKANMLIEKHGALRITQEEALPSFKAGLGVVCVVDNGPFEAAAYAYCEGEIHAFSCPDGRPKTWLVMDKETAEALAQ